MAGVAGSVCGGVSVKRSLAVGPVRGAVHGLLAVLGVSWPGSRKRTAGEWRRSMGFAGVVTPLVGVFVDRVAGSGVA